VALKLDRRGHGRKPVNILATLSCGKDVFSCNVIELSDAGARIRFASEFAVAKGLGKLTAAEIGAVDVEVVWQRGDLAGLRFVAVKKRATGVPGAPRS
jgi:hypothetical protein